MNLEIANDVDAELFCAMFQHTKTVSELITIHFLQDQLFFQAMDPSHVSIMEMRIPAAWFTKYELTENGGAAALVTINSAIFFRVLGSREKQQSLRMTYSKAEEKVNISFKGGSGKKVGGGGGGGVDGDAAVVSTGAVKFDKEFSILCLEVDFTLMDIPGGETYDAELSLPSTSFANNVTTMQTFADTMQIQCSEKRVCFVSKSTETGEMRLVTGDDGSDGDEEEEEVFRFSFSLNYLHTICLYHKIAKELVLHMKVGYPMKAVYDLGNDISILFYLAPKVDDDDGEK